MKYMALLLENKSILFLLILITITIQVQWSQTYVY